MDSISVKNNQSLFDIAVEHTGSIETLLELAFANGISITDNLIAASELTPTSIADKKTATLFGNLKNKPATGLSRQEIRELCDEVGSNTADFGTFSYHFDDSFYK